MREGVRARFVGFEVSVPVFTVLVRKCYGVAGGGMIDRRGLNFKIGVGFGELGIAPGGRRRQGGAIGARSNVPRSGGTEREIEEELRQLGSPFGFAIEDLIDPRETRPYLCQFVEAQPVGGSGRSRSLA